MKSEARLGSVLGGSGGIGGVNVGVIVVEEDGVVGLIGVVGGLVDSGGVDVGGIGVDVVGGSIDDMDGVEMAEEGTGGASPLQEAETISRQMAKMRLRQSLLFMVVVFPL